MRSTGRTTCAGTSQLVMVNLDFEVSLDRRRAERYLAACETLDSRLRERLVLVLCGMPKGIPKSRILECVLRLRPYCHCIGFQSEGCEAPAADASLLSGTIAVLHEDKLAVQGPTDPERLGRLIGSMHARQANVLLRCLPKWQDLKPLARTGIDLISVAEDERDAGELG